MLICLRLRCPTGSQSRESVGENQAAAKGRFGSTCELVHLVDEQACVRGTQFGSRRIRGFIDVRAGARIHDELDVEERFTLCSFIIMCSFLFGDDL